MYQVGDMLRVDKDPTSLPSRFSMGVFKITEVEEYEEEVDEDGDIIHEGGHTYTLVCVKESVSDRPSLVVRVGSEHYLNDYELESCHKVTNKSHLPAWF